MLLRLDHSSDLPIYQQIRDQVVVAYAFNPRTPKTKAGRCL